MILYFKDDLVHTGDIDDSIVSLLEFNKKLARAVRPSNRKVSTDDV